MPQPTPYSRQALTASQEEAVGKSGRLSSSYLQAYLARLLNNVCLRVENLVIKFLDGESHALTLNLQSLDLYSTDALWNRAFVSETGSVRAPAQASRQSKAPPPNSASPSSTHNWILHKVAHLRDLNVCLDPLAPAAAAASPGGPSPGSAVRTGAGGQHHSRSTSQAAHTRAQSPMSGADKERLFESFQPPLLYRFSLECRMQMETGTPDGIRLTHLSLLVRDQLELSMTRTQLVGLLRMMDLALELYYASASDALLNTTPTLTESDFVLLDAYTEESTSGAGAGAGAGSGSTAGPDDQPQALFPLRESPLQSKQSWSEWAWSYVWPLDMEPPAPDGSLLADDGALLAIESADSSSSAVPDVAPQLSILVCDVAIPKFSIAFKTIDYRPLAQTPTSAPTAPADATPAEGTASKSTESQSQVKAFGRGTEIPVTPEEATEASADRLKTRRATPRFRKFLEFQLTGVSCTVRREGDSFLNSQFGALDMHLLTSGQCTCFNESHYASHIDGPLNPFLRCPPLLIDLPDPINNRLLSISHPESANLSAPDFSALHFSLPESLFCNSTSSPEKPYSNALKQLYSSVRSQTEASTQSSAQAAVSPKQLGALDAVSARCTTLEEHLALFDERWPHAHRKALWMDYTSTVQRESDSEAETDADAETEQLLPQEATLVRCVLQDMTSELSVGALHRLLHLSEALSDYMHVRRIASCTSSGGGSGGAAPRALPFAASRENLERFLPLKRYHNLLGSLSLRFLPGDVLGLEALPLLKASCAQLSSHASKPMYPNRVQLVLDSLPGPLDDIAHLTYRSSTLEVRHCSIISAQFQAYLSFIHIS